MAESYSLKAILSADGSGMSSTFNQIAGQVGGLQKTLMGGIGFGVMSAIGGKAVDLVSNGVKALGSTVMDSGMSFEAAGSQIAATMGKSKSEITDIINEASRLGATTSFTATQAAEGFNVLAMSGLEAGDQIAAMEPILHLAAAGSYELSTAAEQVVGTVKGFGDGFDKAQYYADMFAKGATLASTDVNMLGRAMADSAANASSFGQESDRTCIALLRLAEQGVTGSEAATALNRAMTDLYNATGPAQEELDKLGVKVYDDSGKARDFNTVVDELKDSMSGMTDEERNAAEGAIFSSYGLKAFNKMCVSSTEKVKKFEDGLKSASGSAAAQASEQLNNLKGDMTILGSAAEGLGVTIFSKIGGGFRTAAQLATKALTTINDVLSGKALTGSGFITNAGLYFANFLPYAKQVGSAFESAFSAVGKALAKLNSKFGSLSSLGNFAKKCSSAKDAFVSFAGYIESHADQIAKLITMLPNVAAAFAGFNAASKAMPILQGVAGAAGNLASIFGVKVPSAALSAGKSFTSFAGNFAGKAGKAVSHAAKEMGYNLLNITPPSVLGKISSSLDAVGGKFSSFGGTIKNKLLPPDGLGTIIVGKVKAIGGPIASALSSIGGKATSLVSTIFSGLIRTAASCLVPVAIIAALLAGMGLIYSTFGTQIDQILSLAQTKGPGIINGLVTAITTALPGLIMAGAQMMAGIMNTITANLPAIISGGVAIIGSLASGLASALPTLIPAAVNMIGTLVSGLLGAIPQVITIGMQFLLSLAQGIAANLPLILTKAHEAVTNFVQGVITNLPTILSTAVQIITTLVQGIVSNLPQLLSQGMQLIVMVGQGIISNLPMILGSGAQIIGTLLSGILSAVGTLLTSIPSIMGQLVDTIMATDWIKVGGDILRAIGEGLFGGLAGIGGKIGQFFSTAKDWVTGGQEGGTKTVTAAQQSVTAGAGAFSTAVGSMAQGGAQAFSTNISSMGTAANTAMTAVTSSLSTAEAGMNSIGGAAGSAMSSLTSAFSSVESGTNSMQSVVSSDMSSIESSVQQGASNVSSAVQSGVDRTNAAITAGGARAKSMVTNTVSNIVATMNRGATQAGVAGQQTGQGYASGIASASGAASAAASSLVSAAIGAMNNGYASAYSAGSYIGQGLAAGLASQAGAVASQAAQLAAAADAAIQAQAKVGSPAKVEMEDGYWMGAGLAVGLMKAKGLVEKQATRIAAIPSKILDRAHADIDVFAEDARLDESLSYHRDQTIIVKTYIDKREVGRAAASTSGDYERSDNRRRGIRS